MWEGNGGKPIAIPRVWNYTLFIHKNCLIKMTLLRNNISYWTFHAKEGIDGYETVKRTMKVLFDLASGIAEELPTNEIADFLTTIEEISNKMKAIVIES